MNGQSVSWSNIKHSDHNNRKVSRAVLEAKREKNDDAMEKDICTTHVWTSLHSLPETRKATWNYYPTLCEQQVSLNQLHVVHLVYRAIVYRRALHTHGIFKETLSKVVPQALLFAASRWKLPGWSNIFPIQSPVYGTNCTQGSGLRVGLAIMSTADNMTLYISIYR